MVIGYPVGTTVTINELGSREPEAASEDASVEMPEGHPDIELDEEGNAKVVDGSAAPVSNDPLTLANNFFDMGMSAMNGAKSEEDQLKARDVFKRAIVHYDEYLANNASPAAEVDRAICVFYAGEHEQAIADLEAFVARDATFAPAWANLGMFYESHGDADKAEKAYRKAVDTAAEDDTYGVGDYARERLEALEQVNDRAERDSIERHGYGTRHHHASQCRALPHRRRGRDRHLERRQAPQRNRSGP
ncbi:MAG: hypothetical protein ACLTSX_09655 [Collinsella sp.]